MLLAICLLLLALPLRCDIPEPPLWTARRAVEPEGWFYAQNATSFLLCAILAEGIEGAVVEIGVHYGKSFIHLLQFGEENRLDPFVAIDLFENQALNRDHSGKGSRHMFNRNLRRFAHGNMDLVKTLTGRSQDLTAADIFNVTNGKRVAFFSIDGCHDLPCTLHDMHLAFEVLHDKGLIMLDDIPHPGWPGVGMAIPLFLKDMQYKAVGLAYGRNKFYISKAGAASFYWNQFHELCRKHGVEPCDKVKCSACVRHARCAPSSAVTDGALLEINI